MLDARRVCIVMCAAVGFAFPAHAQVPVVFGEHIDRLQKLVDHLYGRGNIHVTTDYIGARPGDPDPWFWVGRGFAGVLIRDHTDGAKRDVVCWYAEDGSEPIFPGNGIVFRDHGRRDATAVIVFPHPETRFGFLLDPHPEREHGRGECEPELFFTNRRWNDPGADGLRTKHDRFSGDMRALVFDVSRWSSPNTWLVCFEDHDAGRRGEGPCVEDGPGDTPDPVAERLVGPGHPHADNDFADVVFEIQALRATPITPVSFGALKLRYR